MAAPQPVTRREPAPGEPLPVRRRPPLPTLGGLGLVLAIALVYRGVLRGEVLAGRDLFRLFIPYGAFLRESLLVGRLPWWNPYVRLGEPFVATLQSQVFYPPNVIAVLLAGATWAPTVLQLFHTALAGAGVFVALRSLGRTRAAAVLGGAVFALSPFFTQAAVVPNIAGTLAWSGFVIAGAVGVARRRNVAAAAWLALPLGLSALCGAPEITLCEAAIAFFVTVALSRLGRNVGLAVLGCLWAVALSALALVPAAELLLHSNRALHAVRLPWSASVPQLISAFVPFADLPTSQYWGSDQALFLSLFLGTTTGMLVVLGLRRKPLQLTLAALTAAFGLLALGHHFAPARFLLTHPPLAVFRYPAKAFAGVAICVPLLAAFGFDRLGAIARRTTVPVRWAGVAVLGALLLVAVGLPVVQRLPIRSGFAMGWIWLVAVALALGCVFALVPRGRTRASRVRAGVAGVLGAELLFFALRFPVTGWADPKNLDEPSSTAAAIRTSNPGARISVVLPETTTAQAGVSARTYVERSRNALIPLQNVREHLPSLEGYAPPDPARGLQFEQGAPRSVYELLGVGAFVRAGDGPFAGLRPVATVTGVSRTWIGGSPMPHAFVVYRAEQVDDAGALAAITDPSELFRTTAFVDVPVSLRAAPRCLGPTPATVRDVANQVDVDVDACADGILVLTDRDYPGWEARIDGAPAAILRTDWLVRGVRVPPGRHHVVFAYRPLSAKTGAAVSLVAWLTAAAALLDRRRRTRRRIA